MRKKMIEKERIHDEERKAKKINGDWKEKKKKWKTSMMEKMPKNKWGLKKEKKNMIEKKEMMKKE